METKIKWYAKNKAELLAYLEAGPEGLSTTEVEKRLAYFGPNTLPKAKQQSVFVLFFKQFASPLIYLLLAAAAIVMVMGEYIDGTIIALVLLLNAVIGSIQEGRAAKTLASLQKLVTTTATALRNGKEIILSDEELVPGDILIIREGEKVPADCRILEQSSIRVNESSLTGESVSQEKHAETIAASGTPLPTSQQLNLLFKGTLVTSGNCKAVVVATGVETVMGSISGQVLHIQREIPLQRNIRHLANVLIVVVLGCSILLFLAGIWRGLPVREVFGTVVSLAVSVIPEGLPIAVTLILASGVWRMSKRNALVKKLQAIESLGQVDIVAVDKTGTITKNEMTVVEILAGKQRFTFTGSGYEEGGGVFLNNEAVTAQNSPELMHAAKVFALCGDARITKNEETGEFQIAGDPTDAALVIAAKKLGLVRDELIAEYPLIEELPFDYRRKFHATVNKIGKEYFLSAVGAVEAILPLCEYANKKSVLLQAKHASGKGLRVLAFAYNEKARMTSDGLPKLNFGGLVLMTDPLLPEVAESVEALYQAGINVAMLTGDNAVTARAIAENAGISKEGDTVLTSAELYKLSKEELAEQLSATSVFARVTPEDKLKLVEAYSRAGLTVAMTGDGVNDAPALLAADIGMAMGKGGTEVAKESADIVLLDNNFKTIVAAVEEGRNIFLTIKKVLLYLFSTSIGELFAVSGAVLLGFPLPVVAVQIIWLNFVTDGFLTVALGMEPRGEDLLAKPFKKPSRFLIDTDTLFRMSWLGLVMAAVTLYVFTAHEGSLIYRQSVALTLLAVLQWFNAWNTRSEKSIFSSKPWKNGWLLLATFVVAVLQLGALYWQPMQKVLRTVPISLDDWLRILLYSLVIILADEIYKLIRLLFKKRP